ncbi:uncharacterized protein A1O9_05190 [Exophiala aquamarina CBS 119918]|uniref:Uncharacterized protein n=1 Tax=Exophiala aquamarina CBS 119918 TaxID=1182545 RepID=A0A072PDD8_9EURO|nr:uncharacterized protein A1O9_05190 [Exophiala aquamarina CBS 119918]KEF57273.1 hypothetical protein A1O9_05190 [Exophiala aquamarina CBS 119918]
MSNAADIDAPAVIAAIRHPPGQSRIETRQAVSTGPIAPPEPIEYHIAVICALEEEAEAVRAAFDHRWDLQAEGDNIVKHHGDKNQYNTGVIVKHNVVLATPD